MFISGPQIIQSSHRAADQHINNLSVLWSRYAYWRPIGKTFKLAVWIKEGFQKRVPFDLWLENIEVSMLKVEIMLWMLNSIFYGNNYFNWSSLLNLSCKASVFQDHNWMNEWMDNGMHCQRLGVSGEFGRILLPDTVKQKKKSGM